MIGKIISHYKILEELGHGGMGVVYLAEDTKLKRNVAIKFLPSHLTKDEESRKRFEREAQAAAALNHPNIVTVYEIGEFEDQIYISMEYLEGKTLRDWLIENHQISIMNCINIATQICEGLKRAHQSGIVHRDIKPGNIMINKDNRIKILDFGLAKLADYAQLTKDTTTLGTVSFMSPEQSKGEEVDHRTDIWSTGVILYQMATAKLPFKGNYEQAIIYSILNQDPDPLMRLRTDAPIKLDKIVNKALAKSYDKRYKRIDEMSVDLQSLSHDLKSGKTKQEIIPTRKRNLFWGSAISFIILLFILLYIFVLSNSPYKDRRSIAVLPFENMNKDEQSEYFSDGITEDIITQLSKIGNLKVISRTSSMQYKGKEKNLKEIGDELDVATILEGSIRQDGNDVRITAKLIDVQTDENIWAERYDREMTGIFAIQSDVAQKIAVALKTTLSPEEKVRIERKPTDNLQAYNLYLQGRYFWNKRTQDGINKGIDYFQQAIEKDSTYAVAYTGLADSYILIGWFDWASPKETFPKAKEAAMKALEINPSLAEAHTSLGAIRMNYDWDWAGAEKQFKRAIELNPNYATAYHWFAFYLSAMERHDEALTQIRRAQSLDPRSLGINVNVGKMLYFQRRYDEAITQARKTIDMDPEFIQSYELISDAYFDTRKFSEAIAAVEKGLILSENHPKWKARLAACYAASGQKEKAYKIAEELEVESKQRYISPVTLSGIYLWLGENDKYFNELEKAYQERHWIFCFQFAPGFDSIRSNPRFISLLRKVGLKE